MDLGPIISLAHLRCLKLPDEVAEKLLKFGMEDEVDEEQRLIEERRKRLQEIKARHQQQMAVAGGHFCMVCDILWFF